MIHINAHNFAHENSRHSRVHPSFPIGALLVDSFGVGFRIWKALDTKSNGIKEVNGSLMSKMRLSSVIRRASKG